MSMSSAPPRKRAMLLCGLLGGMLGGALAAAAIALTPAVGAQEQQQQEQKQAPRVQLGEPISEDQLLGFDLIAAPDGGGMPPGAGTARQGREVYALNCLRCHNANGEGVSAITVLAGGDMDSEEPPLRTVGSFWPHASTLFDFIRRAMPADMPKTLSDEEVYQVTAYVLFLNGIIGEDESINSETLTAITMPNGDGFIDRSHLLY